METMQKDDLIRTILSMPPIERIEIVEKVLNGFNSEKDTNIENLWKDESESRLEGYLKGEIKGIPSDDVFNKINSLR